MSVALAFAAALMAQSAPQYVAIGPTNCPRNSEADRQTPEAQHEVFCFVGWLYGPRVMDTLTPLGRGAPRVFTTGTRAAMAAARARPRGGDSHAAFDADPVCDCQDPTGLRLLVLTVPEWENGRAVATVRFDFGAGTDTFDPAQARQRTLILRREAEGWRVEDIRTEDGAWSFRRALAAD